MVTICGGMSLGSTTSARSSSARSAARFATSAAGARSSSASMRSRSTRERVIGGLVLMIHPGSRWVSHKSARRNESRPGVHGRRDAFAKSRHGSNKTMDNRRLGTRPMDGSAAVTMLGMLPEAPAESQAPGAMVGGAGEEPVAGQLSGAVRFRGLLFLVAAAFFMQSLDSTVVNTAVPAMAGALDVTPLGMRTALTSYVLTLAILIPASPWLCDRL